MAPTERMVAAGYQGKLVAGRYKLDRMLGSGAVGEVWLAEHIHMRKRFALKLLDARIATPEIVARFEREAVAAANVTHPGIAAGTDFGRDEDGSFFLVLEYVSGKSLRKLIEEGLIHPLRALGIARQILVAIGAAHAKGVVHRDLKPENVMLAERDDVDVRSPLAPSKDVVKVLDFGIAKLDPASLGGSAQLTRAGTVYGTPTYMAPEQALGEPVDARADLYAVGVLLFEMISGKPPFVGEPLEVIAHQVNEDAPALSSKAENVTPELETLVATLLRRLRAERPADVEAALALVTAAETSYASKPPAAALATEKLPARKAPIDKRKWMAIAGVAALVFAVLGIVLLANGGKSKQDDEETSRPKPKPLSNVQASASASASPSASASASASSAPSTKPSAAPATVTKKTTTTKSNEKGFGKLKSIFK